MVTVPSTFTLVYPGSPTTIFRGWFPSFTIILEWVKIIFQKEPLFLKWWLTSRVYVYIYMCEKILMTKKVIVELNFLEI